MSATFNNFSASYNAKEPAEVIACVPLFNARPSFADNSIVGIPAFFIASSPGRTSPSYSAMPSPIIGRTIWDNGAKSPEAPNEPF